MSVNALGFDPELGEVQVIGLNRFEDHSAQTRADTSNEAVEEYAQKLRDGIELDPAEAYWDGSCLRLSSGFHRLKAYRCAGRERMPCCVRRGGRKDAIEAGVRGNAKHGTKLTRRDKHRNVELLIEIHPDWSDREIANAVGVSHPFVATVRRPKPFQSGNVTTLPAPNVPATSPGRQIAGSNSAGSKAPPGMDGVQTVWRGGEPATASAPRPSGRPINDSFADCQKLLAKVSSIMNFLKNAKPSGGMFRHCDGALTELSRSLEEWRKAVHRPTGRDSAAAEQWNEVEVGFEKPPVSVDAPF